MKHFTLLLRDGRTLAWREYGALTSGYPIIFAHGNLNSSMYQPSWSKTTLQTETAKARVIAVDRPGYGNTSPHPDRTYSDFALDMKELVAHLSIQKFAVVGYSSGGPHALACAAARLPGLTSCTLVASDAPYFKLNMVQQVYGVETVTLENARQMAEKNCSEMSNSYASMSKPDRVDIALADIQHATKQGYVGAASDSVLEASESWGFEFEGLGKRTAVSIWHGTDDQDVPLEAGQYLMDRIGGGGSGKCHILEGENHTLIRRHWESILTEAVALGDQIPECGEGKL